MAGIRFAGLHKDVDASELQGLFNNIRAWATLRSGAQQDRTSMLNENSPPEQRAVLLLMPVSGLAGPLCCCPSICCAREGHPGCLVH